ncbi:MAG: glycoside hydrolase family 3 C-terminal domain-containing protein [Tepidisphaeraceae bacterium]|jgi:beta-glucosidase
MNCRLLPWISVLLWAAIVLSMFSRAGAQTNPSDAYLNPDLPFDVRVHDLIGRLTLEEKADLLNHLGPEVTRFNILSDRWNQCLHGVWWTRPTTMYPVSIALAATWDTDLVHQEADAISDEARGIYNGWHIDPNAPGEHKGLIYRAPVINVSRNPYWGRINECFGEDPYLDGRIGVAYVKGLQGHDPHYLKIAATLKHFAVNNVELNRKKLNAVVPERMLYEFWLPHFRDCVVEGGAQSVMASYNAINGTPNNINSLLLTDILKKQWGFTGFVVSDLGGVGTMVNGHEQGKMSVENAVAQSLMAGCDFSDDEFTKQIPAAIKDGLLTEDRLDDALFRVLMVRFKLGEFDPPDRVPYTKISPDVICSPEHRALALHVAQESIVLLTNPSNILPLDRDKIKTLAIIGPHADIFTPGGYSGVPDHPVTPLVGIRNRANPQTQILFAAGCPMTPDRNSRATRPAFDRAAELQKAVDAAKSADVAVVFVGTTTAHESEDHDRISLSLPEDQEALVAAVIAANPKTIVVEMNAGPLTEPTIKQNAAAMLEAWWDGEEGGDAIADVLFGNVNPGAKMPLTVYASPDQVPPQDEYDVTKGFTYMYIKGKPLFAFGHGLSYTTFAYSNLQVTPREMKPDGQATITVDVQNTGARAGDEVAQMYVHEVTPAVIRPIEQLRGFSRISLAPGEKKTVTFSLPGSQLAYYDVNVHNFVTKPGAFDILVGSASDDIRATDQIRVDAPN